MIKKAFILLKKYLFFSTIFVINLILLWIFSVEVQVNDLPSYTWNYAKNYKSTFGSIGDLKQDWNCSHQSNIGVYEDIPRNFRGESLSLSLQRQQADILYPWKKTLNQFSFDYESARINEKKNWGIYTLPEVSSVFNEKFGAYLKKKKKKRN